MVSNAGNRTKSRNRTNYYIQNSIKAGIVPKTGIVPKAGICSKAGIVPNQAYRYQWSINNSPTSLLNESNAFFDQPSGKDTVYSCVRRKPCLVGLASVSAPYLSGSVDRSPISGTLNSVVGSRIRDPEPKNNDPSWNGPSHSCKFIDISNSKIGLKSTLPSSPHHSNSRVLYAEMGYVLLAS